MKNLKLSILVLLSIASLNVLSAKKENTPYTRSLQTLSDLKEVNEEAFSAGHLSQYEHQENLLALSSIQKQIESKEHMERILTQLSIRTQLIQEQMLTR